ncbi:SMP-30/gluconolactonase/LRE family protein [Arthrobacter sp. efr-133-TYG-104]|uniref:SMP-30/gluconolactonase/LRE family protein n=1 Tax=Arthrobacter sp. efr-133-TYG-104 TaxID=3040324 RepID=UPI00254AAAE6|nr:SMP-30/gluconolactonase/LRE family protein [Arthrobacter sp. efr-133-TYG-104]
MTRTSQLTTIGEAHFTTGVPASVIGTGLRTVAEGLDHAEGVCWSPRDQVLYAGGEGGQVYRFSLDGGPVETVCTVPGGSMLGLAVDATGHVYVCDTGNGCIQQVATDGRIRRFGDAIGYPNYPVFDSTGNLWVSDSGDWGKPNGGIVRIDPDGTTERVLEGLHFANGLAIDGDWLYIVESTWPRITRMPLNGGDPEVVVVLDQVVPDGLAFDAEGGLWISCWQPNRVYRLSVDGQLHVEVDDWSGVYAPTPTNLAFAGPQLNVLVLASLGTGSVNACDPGVHGSPLHLPIRP